MKGFIGKSERHGPTLVKESEIHEQDKPRR
jgi:hypothetical protein